MRGLTSVHRPEHLSASLGLVHGMRPRKSAQDHEPNVCEDRPVPVAQNVSLFVLVCVWLTDMVCVLRNYAKDVWPKVYRVNVCGDRAASTAQNISLLLWARVCATDIVCAPEIRPKILCPSPRTSHCLFWYGSA